MTDAYRKNKWAAQPVRVELWSEKGTVRSTLAPVLDRYEVPFRAVGGFAGATIVKNGADAAAEGGDRPTLILYVGDWDPSGLCMSERDLPKRLARYASTDPSADIPDDLIPTYLASARISIERIALTAADIGDPALPSFPASDKRGDSRYPWFVTRYGTRCWELDALSPAILRARVEEAIRARLDLQAWERYVEAEQVERDSIIATVRAWSSTG